MVGVLYSLKALSWAESRIGLGMGSFLSVILARVPPPDYSALVSRFQGAGTIYRLSSIASDAMFRLALAIRNDTLILGEPLEGLVGPVSQRWEIPIRCRSDQTRCVPFESIFKVD